MFILASANSRAARFAACLAVILSVTIPPSDASASTEASPEQAVVGPWRAAYLPHGWIATPRPREQITASVCELRRMAMNTQIHNIGAMDATGSVPTEEYSGLARWIDVSRQVEPDHEIILWISGDTATHVSGAALHGSIATWLTSLVGSHDVDGLFLDLEPFGVDDPDLVALLRTIAARMPDTWIGLAAPGDGRWSDDYIQTLSTTVDGLSSLLYDTSISDVAEYRDRVAVEVARYQQAAGSRALVVPSLPSYQANTWHDPAVENIAEAMQALRSLDRPADGAAIYWWWEFDDESRRSWLRAMESGSDSDFSDVGEDNPHHAEEGTGMNVDDTGVYDMTRCIPPDTFSDDDLNQFESAIEWLAAEGITQGCNPPANDRFCPDDPVTRGQMATFLVRTLGYTNDGGGSWFKDTAGSTFERAIDRLRTAGVTHGCNPPANDRFCPDELVTRGQMAAFLVRAFGFIDSGAGDYFTDDDASAFETAIDRLRTAGVTLGCNPPDNDHYCPRENVTRGQMAAFMKRAVTG